VNIAEILFEAYVGILHHAGIDVHVNSHAISRAKENRPRRIVPTDVDLSLSKLPTIKDQMEEIGQNQQFWVYDRTLQIGLGMRKGSDKRGLMQLDLNTLISSPPRGDFNPTIMID
jgi:hypothetical protein